VTSSPPKLVFTKRQLKDPSIFLLPAVLTCGDGTRINLTTADYASSSADMWQRCLLQGNHNGGNSYFS